MATTEDEKKAAEAQKALAEAAAQKAKEAEAAKPAKAAKVAQKADLVTAVHEIHQTNDAGEREVVAPGTVFAPAKVDMADYVKHGAVREPTEAEIALYERTKAKTDDVLGG